MSHLDPKNGELFVMVMTKDFDLRKDIGEAHPIFTLI